MFYITSVEEFCRSNAVDDAKRNEGLMTPEDISRVDDLCYGDHPRHVLDLYRPKQYEGKLPIIISAHGGGWVYGNKEIMQFYCMSLAQHGFAVVSYNYRLAPEFLHPIPLNDLHSVVKWVFAHAGEYDLDTNNIFFVGDSVGANILGQYTHACLDPEFAAKVNIDPLPGFLPSALGLNSGLFMLERGKELLLDGLASKYMPNGGTDKEYEELSLYNHVSSAFPPCFVMSAEKDFLMDQAEPFAKHLQSLGVEVEYHCYKDEKVDLTHVFHINIKLEKARLANADECAFFKRHLK